MESLVMNVICAGKINEGLAIDVTELDAASNKVLIKLGIL
jgi:DNA polymerase III gamma/tau subunit